MAEEVLLDNEGVIFNRVRDTGVGNGGRVEINTTNLSILNDGEINASTFGQGNTVSTLIINLGEE